MRDRAILMVLLWVLCGATALAQTEPAPPKPGPEAQKLGIFVGKWKIEGDLPPGAMGTPGGKTRGTAACESISEGSGVLCHETMPMPGGRGSLTDVYILAYDEDAKNYFFSEVGAGGVVWVGHGTVNGDTWVWVVDSTMDGKPIHVRFTDKWTSADSFDFKNEIGSNADSMSVMMAGKQIRVAVRAARPVSK
jgi:Protein of unknown function (DUF1579)